MKADWLKIECYRTQVAHMPPTKPGDRWGMFQFKRHGIGIRVIFCDGDEMGWEHASVTVIGQKRCPTWEEMCAVKDLFWEHEERVVQFHPPRSEYVSDHPFCLHLWKCVGQEFPAPDPIMVGRL